MKQTNSGTNTAKSTEVPDRFQGGWLTALDGRLSLARELRGRYRELTDDLGGLDALSYQRRTLAERAVWLEYHLAQQEQSLAAGTGDFNPGQWTQACNALVGLLKTLGLDRKAADVPDLATYLARKEREKEATQ